MDSQTFLTTVGMVPVQGTQPSGGSVPSEGITHSVDFVLANHTDYLRRFSDTTHLGTGDSTIIVWIRPTFLGTDAGTRFICSKGSSTAGADLRSYGISINDVFDDARFYTSDGVTVVEVASDQNEVINNQWNYIVCQYDSDTSISSIQVNNGTVWTTEEVNPPQSLSEANLFVGAGQVGSTHWGGQICLFGIWSRKLSGAEITSIYSNGTGKTWSNLSAGEQTNAVVYWHLDELSGTRADSAGSLDLSETGTVGSSTEVPS